MDRDLTAEDRKKIEIYDATVEHYRALGHDYEFAFDRAGEVVRQYEKQQKADKAFRDAAWDGRRWLA